MWYNYGSNEVYRKEKKIIKKMLYVRVYVIVVFSVGFKRLDFIF